MTNLIQAEKNIHPKMIWQFSELDKVCKRMSICGTRIFDSEPNIELMKNGLKKLLVYYPHLAGRIKDRNEIIYTNEGVEFQTREEKNISIKDIPHIKNPREYFASNISTKKVIAGKQAPMNINITKLKDGYVLSVQCSHACMDGQSFYRMVEHRGKLSRNQDIDLPLLDQSCISQPRTSTKEHILTSALHHGWIKLGLGSLVMLIWTTFLGRTKKRSSPQYFSWNDLSKIKKDIQDKKNLSCSTHVALSAYLTKKCIENIGLSADTKCSQVTVVNVRDRIASIPMSFVGNASMTITTQEFSAATSLEDIAQIIQDTLIPKLQKPSPELTELFDININVMHQKVPLAPFNVIGMNTKKPTTFYINNFSTLPIYKPDFGQGMPIQVIPHDLGDQIVIWPAPHQTGGVEVYVAGTLTKYIKKMGIF